NRRPRLTMASDVQSRESMSARAIPALRRTKVPFSYVLMIFMRPRPNKYDPYAMFLRSCRLFGLWLYSAHFGMQIWSGRYRHRVAALRLGVGVAHYRQHVIQRQNSGCLGSSTRLRGGAIDSAFLSSTGFAPNCHRI